MVELLVNAGGGEQPTASKVKVWGTCIVDPPGRDCQKSTDLLVTLTQVQTSTTNYRSTLVHFSLRLSRRCEQLAMMRHTPPTPHPPPPRLPGMGAAAPRSSQHEIKAQRTGKHQGKVLRLLPLQRQLLDKLNLIGMSLGSGSRRDV